MGKKKSGIEPDSNYPAHILKQKQQQLILFIDAESKSLREFAQRPLPVRDVILFLLLLAGVIALGPNWREIRVTF